MATVPACQARALLNKQSFTTVFTEDCGVKYEISLNYFMEYTVVHSFMELPVTTFEFYAILRRIPKFRILYNRS
jgi:hypothetical protein